MTEFISTVCPDCTTKANLEVIDEWRHSGLPIVKTRCRNCEHVTTWGGERVRESLKILGQSTPVS